MGRDDAPEDDFADALIFVAQFVANGPDGMPRRRRMLGEPVRRYAAHRFGYHQDGLGRRSHIGRAGLETLEGRAVADRVKKFDFREDVAQRNDVIFHGAYSTRTASRSMAGFMSGCRASCVPS